jgi:hypothetical protein
MANMSDREREVHEAHSRCMHWSRKMCFEGGEVDLGCLGMFCPVEVIVWWWVWGG